ncbi:MAG: hypothetical protein KAS36_11005 [Anaerolineales bacterium]|nr:hypothetical protein [Anaerolineales bacterium]
MEEEKMRDLIMPNSGCELIETFGTNVTAFIQLCNRTHDVCDGCAYNPCVRMIKLQEKEVELRKRNFGKVNFETNVEIAERLGISKRQAAKMKKRGEI